jgi:hypothetical protein
LIEVKLIAAVVGARNHDKSIPAFPIAQTPNAQTV